MKLKIHFEYDEDNKVLVGAIYTKYGKVGAAVRLNVPKEKLGEAKKLAMAEIEESIRRYLEEKRNEK